MRPSSVLALVLLCLLIAVLSACGQGVAVLDTKAAPPPPEFTEQFRRELGAEIAAAPDDNTILQYVITMDGYADQMRRFRGD